MTVTSSPSRSVQPPRSRSLPGRLLRSRWSTLAVLMIGTFMFVLYGNPEIDC